MFPTHLHGFSPQLYKSIPNAYMLTTNFSCEHIMFIGAVLYLQQFYRSFYLITQKSFEEQLKRIYQDHNNIFIIGVETDQEGQLLVKPKYEDIGTDIFISGTSDKTITTNLNKLLFENTSIYNTNISDEYKRYRASYYFDYIRSLYYHFNLDFSIYVNFWSIPIAKNQIDCICNNKGYKFVLINSACKEFSKTIDLSFVTNYYLPQEQIVIINPYVNMYKQSDPRYMIAESYRNLYFWADYLPILLCAYEIHVIDSFIANIIFPLLFQKKISSNIVNVYDKNTGEKILLLDEVD